MRVKTDRRVKPEIGFFSSSLENKRDKCVSGFTTPFTSYINVSKSSREKNLISFTYPLFFFSTSVAVMDRVLAFVKNVRPKL